MFVRADGPADKLNAFILKTLSVDYYHPESAPEYLSHNDGYSAFTEACPFDQAIRHIEDISQQADVSLNQGVSNVLGTGKALERSYLDKLTKYVSENDFDASDINSFLSGLQSQIDLYGKRYSDLKEREKYLKDRIQNLSHFSTLEVDLNEMLSTKYIDIHFGSMPKDSMVNLYLYNSENKFIFNTYSSDEKYFWGVYCAPKKYAEEAAKIMNAVYFEELTLDPGEGSISDIIESCKGELSKVTAEQNKIREFWEKNSDELIGDYSILLDLQKLWSLRKYAAKKNESFCCIGWIPKNRKKDAKKLFNSVGEIEFTIKDPKASITATSIAESSPFETSIRDIEHLAHHVNYDLSADHLHNCLGNDRPLTEEYMDKFTRYLGSADINSKEASLSGINGEIHTQSLNRLALKRREKYLRRKLKRLAHFTAIDFDIKEIVNVKYTCVHFGRIPKEFEAQIKEKAEKENFIFNVYSSDEKNIWCSYLVLKKDNAAAENYFSTVYFKEYKVDDTEGTVKEIIERCEKELREIEEQKKVIADFWNQHQEQLVDCYSILQDLQRLWHERKNIVSKNGKHIYTGQASKKRKRKIIALYDAVGGFENVDEESFAKNTGKPRLVPPTKLRNPRLFRPYEYYVQMYGMPNYGSIDITSFVAITYTVLFGIMFGDLGQGFVLFIGGILAWKLKKMDLGKILGPCGISSMFFGLIFGSFFGFEEFLDPLYKAVGMSGKPLSVMDSINSILLFDIGIGIALVAVSICINIYSNIKAKQIGAALFDNNGAAGLALYLCGVSLAVKFMSGPDLIPGTVCAVVMPVCAVILFLKEILIGIVDKHENWKPQSISDFIMQNIFEMLEYVLSYFSNTVSFLRVGAFVLVHAGMMMVVFSLAGESENIFVIILGNILVICLEGLLTGIQALRLEFYEMFSRCFEGSGKPFVSLKSILEEKNN